MSAATHPIQICDHEHGCDQWELDTEATGAHYVDPTADPLSHWFIDRIRDLAFCPDHKVCGADVPGTVPAWAGEDQIDPCTCVLPAGHEGEHRCDHEGEEDRG